MDITGPKFAESQNSGSRATLLYCLMSSVPDVANGALFYHIKKYRFLHIWVLTVARTGGGKIEQKTTCPTLYIIVTGRHLFIMEQCVPDPHTFCDAVSHPGPL